MSHWQNFDFENRIRKILSEITYTSESNHHLNRPFMTAYQIAIKFNSLYPKVADTMGYKVGGAKCFIISIHSQRVITKN
ncbi:hypothetical protein AAGC94_13675 [Clostridium sporogenes]|uniref:hypothetical protein n=1 Tax=Clostridium sporogenes TaxID=1509 RepID=UPI00313C8C86